MERPPGAGRAVLGAAARRGPDDGAARARLNAAPTLLPARLGCTVQGVCADGPLPDPRAREAEGEHDAGAARRPRAHAAAPLPRPRRHAGARHAGRGDAPARAGARRPLRRPRRAARRPRAGRVRRDHEGDRGLRPRRATCASRSYATPTVLGEIKRHFRDKTWAVRVPRGTQEMQLQVAKARDELTNDARPLADGASSSRRRSTRRSRTCSRRSRAPTRAARARSTSRSARTRRSPTRSASATPSSAARRSACSSTARSTCSPTRDREILRLRFEEDLTQTEISRQIGVSQMQVSRLIRQALARLRMNIERNDRTVIDAA